MTWVPIAGKSERQYGRTSVLRSVDTLVVHWFEAAAHGCEPFLLLPTAVLQAPSTRPRTVPGHWVLGELGWDAPLTLILEPELESIRIRAEQLGGPELAWKISMPAEVRISRAELRGMRVE